MDFVVTAGSARLATREGFIMKSFFFVRYLLAGNATRGVRNLYRLAKHSHHRIRQHVAENPSCPQDLLAILAHDPHPDVRMASALNPNTDLDTKILLSADDHPDVRFRIAATSYMPTALLKALSEDDNPYVQTRARRTLEHLDADCALRASRPISAR